VNLIAVLYLIPYFVSVAIAVWIGAYAFRHREVHGAFFFGVFSLLQSLTTLLYIFELISPSLDAKIFWDNAQFLVLFIWPIFFLGFVFDYTSTKIEHLKRFWGIMSIIPIVSSILVLTNRFHGLIRSEAWLVPGTPFDALVYEFTPTVWIVTILIYGIILTGMWLLILGFIQAHKIYRLQIGFVIAGISIPLLGYLFTLFDLIPTFQRDIAPFTFAIGNLFIAWGLFKYQLFNFSPIARDTVFNNLTDFVIVIDHKSRIIDINPAAQKILGKSVSETLGKPIKDIYSDYGKLIEKFSGVSSAHEEISLETNGEKSYFSVNVSPLHDRRERLIGRVIVVRNITERKLADKALENYRTELEEIVEARTTGLMAANDSLKQEIFERKKVEKSLRQTKQQFQDILDNSQAVFYTKSLDGIYTFVNREFRERTGINEQDFNGKTTTDLFPNLEEGIWNVFEQKVLETGEPINVEEIGQTTGKTYLATKFLLRDSEGVPYALCNSSIDISDRVQAEKALQQYVQRLEALRIIDQAIIEAQTPESIAQTALKHIHNLISCFYTNVLVFDSDAGTAHLLAYQFETQVNQPLQKDIPLSNFRQTFHPDEVYIREDLELASDLSLIEKELLQIGVRACIKVPLVSQDTVIGSLNLGLEEPGRLLDDQIEIIKEIADQLAIAIQQANLIERIRLYADKLEIRIAERTAELEAVNQHLQELSQVKDEFVSNVSHELRTPITSLKLYHDLLLLQPEKMEDYMGTLKRETNRLEVLIEDLLTLSRLDQERVSFNLSDSDLNKTISTYLSDRSLLAAQKGINLSFYADPDLPTVRTDKNLIEQVLSILLTNAINYTPSNHQVSVSTRKHQTNGQLWVGFSIRDTGPGIQKDEIDQLFNRFYRGKVGQKSGIPGTGLGLAIAQEIIKRHGGYFEVESEGITGKGSIFTVWLPGQSTDTDH